MSSASAADTPLRFMTYNIRFLNTSDGPDVWPNRSQAVIETLQTADVIGLQEVVAEQLDAIQQATPEFSWYGVGRDDGAERGEMTAIGWRSDRVEVHSRGTIWLSPTPQEVGSRGWDAALPRIASWIVLSRSGNEAERLLLVNTHFDHRGEQARRNSAKLLLDWVRQKRGQQPAVLMGDLNATTQDRPLQILLEGDDPQSRPRFSDARVLSRTPDSGPNSTWNGFREIQPDRRIDHVLVLGELEVANYQTLDPRTREDRFASDHLPIRTALAW